MSSSDAPDTSMPRAVMRSRVSATWSADRSFGSRPCARLELNTIDVPMWPGITTDAFTCGALTRRSTTSASVNPFTANLAALYAVCGIEGPSAAQKPFTLLVLIRCPSGLAISIGRNAREP